MHARRDERRGEREEQAKGQYAVHGLLRHATRDEGAGGVMGETPATAEALSLISQGKAQPAGE
jgi:hypothetical protein